ncbi:MAG: O-antigen ligase family protein [Acidobacteriaceae bacterium]
MIFLLALPVVLLAMACIRHPHLGLCVMLLAFIPAPLYPMDPYGWVFYGFAGFLLLLLAGWFLRIAAHASPFHNAARHEGIATSIQLWLALCAIGLPLSLLFNQGSIPDRLYFFAKGALPFVYLLVFFVVRALPFAERQVHRLLACLLAVAIAFAIISFAIYAATGMRVTWIYGPLVFPFPALGANIAFARMFTAPARRRAWAWALLTGILILAVVLTFTKAQVIALFASLLLIAFLMARQTSAHILARTAGFATVAAALAICALVSASRDARTGFSDLVAARISDTGTTETRMAESQAALAQFAQSPVIGKGIGYQLERVEFGESISSNYVHNEVTYVGMTMGLAGLVVYFMMLRHWGALIRRRRRPASWAVPALHGCVLTLMVYALMFASFRTIQHNCLLGIFLALLLNLSRADHQLVNVADALA